MIICRPHENVKNGFWVTIDYERLQELVDQTERPEITHNWGRPPGSKNPRQNDAGFPEQENPRQNDAGFTENPRQNDDPMREPYDPSFSYNPEKKPTTSDEVLGVETADTFVVQECIPDS